MDDQKKIQELENKIRELSGKNSFYEAIIENFPYGVQVFEPEWLFLLVQKHCKK